MMDWTKLLQPLRIGESISHYEDGRSPFHKDQDRIVFSSAFRRLDRKTQVHPLSENDHVHSRLTHSLEVSCVGRSLGFRVAEGLKEKGHCEFPDGISAADVGAILQAACLAHDIGNPPYVIPEKMRYAIGFKILKMRTCLRACLSWKERIYKHLKAMLRGFELSRKLNIIDSVVECD